MPPTNSRSRTWPNRHKVSTTGPPEMVERAGSRPREVGRYPVRHPEWRSAVVAMTTAAAGLTVTGTSPVPAEPDVVFIGNWFPASVTPDAFKNEPARTESHFNR